MWANFLKILIQYLGLPLVREGISAFIEWVKKKAEERRIKKEQAIKERAMENAQTPEDIRNSHRSNKL